MLHEDWLTEVQIALGFVAQMVRQGESDENLLGDLGTLKDLVKHWVTWTASDGDGKIFAVQCAEGDGVFYVPPPPLGS